MCVAKRVLVAGGAGFLGSHLCDRLIREGSHVLCVDDLSTGAVNNVAHLLNNPRFDFIQHDVTTPLDAHASEIYNLASPASPVHYQRDPVKTAKTNIIGSVNLLELASRTQAKILQASTSEVYGDPQVHPQMEEYWGHVNPIGPRSCYDEGKRCAETLFNDYRRQYGVHIRIARIFNTYGPRMRPDDGRVICGFITQALAGRDITIFGSGLQTRSFCYVDDLIDGLVRLMASCDDDIGPVNIGNPEETTIVALARKVIELTNSCSALRYEPFPEDDPHRRCPDIRKARSILGWEPTVQLREGLTITIKSCGRRSRTLAPGGSTNRGFIGRAVHPVDDCGPLVRQRQGRDWNR